MRIFTCIDFKGHWPVGGAAVVIAKDEDHARDLLESALRKEGLSLEGDETLKELNSLQPNAFILANGEY